jgi:PTS system protein
MNLTMALTAVVMKDMMEGADLAQVILSEASTALQEFTLAPVEGDDDEEDDI